MSIRLKRYQATVTRVLLLAGYFFLFAGQFNYRYFTIANFYVYHGAAAKSVGAMAGPNHRAGGEVNAVNPARPNPLQHSMALQDNKQRPAHLGIDKRYRFQEGIRVPQIRAPGVVYVGIVTTHFPSITPVYCSSEPPTLSLRGPPRV
jgi:hypothetical protein